MNIFKLLTKKNIEILAAIAEDRFSLREIAEKLECSPAKVHQAVKLFRQNGIINVEEKKNRLIIMPNPDSPVYRKIKALINLSRFLNSKSYKRLKSLGILGIYGSFANGTDDKDSDIDLLILSDKKELFLIEKIRELEKELGKKINPLILTKQKLKDFERKDKEFYMRLKLTTIRLNGDIFE